MAGEKTVSEKLGAPFPQAAIKQRQGGGNRRFDYVEGHTVIHRLNDATGNQWDLAVREITVLEIGTAKLLQARVALTIPGLGTREHLGVQAVNPGGGEDLIKGVITDALKKAATLFGVGLELYGDDYEAPKPVADVPKQPAPPAEVIDRSTGEIIATQPPADAHDTAMKALHATAMGRFAWTHDELHIVAVAKYNVPSLKDLTADQLAKFTARLRQLSIDESAKLLSTSRAELAAKAEPNQPVLTAEPATSGSTRAARFRE